MRRRILIAAAAPILLAGTTALASPERMPSAMESSAEQLDPTSTWIIAAVVVGLIALILFLADSDEDFTPVSP